MTNETMSQEHRQPIHVDINYRDFVQSPSGKPVVSRPTWDPSKGAADAIARVEQQLKAQHERELQRQSLDPAEIRIRGLEQAIQALNDRLLKLEGNQ